MHLKYYVVQLDCYRKDDNVFISSKYLVLIGMVLVSGCDTSKIEPKYITEKPVVFIPDNRFFTCPTIDQYPNPATLTDEQVAEILITLDSNNRICKKSINAIRTQLINAKKTLEAQQ